MSNVELYWKEKNKRKYIKYANLIENKQYSYRINDFHNNNLLIHGDNITVLKTLQKNHQNTIKCVYIDPPYNTGQSFNYGRDFLQHYEWLNFMRQRLMFIKKLLTTDGFVFFQIDNNELHYIKVLMDEVFGRKNYRNSFIVRKSPKKSLFQGDNDKLQMAYHTVLMYSKNTSAKILVTDENENFLRENWLDLFAGGHLTSFTHETNEELLFRIFSLVTKENDIILDAFLGSGTGCAVAHKMKRRWIGIERGEQIYNHAYPRLKKIIDGKDFEGITEKVGWQSGGGFTFLETV